MPGERLPRAPRLFRWPPVPLHATTGAFSHERASALRQKPVAACVREETPSLALYIGTQRWIVLFEHIHRSGELQGIVPDEPEVPAGVSKSPSMSIPSP